MSKETVSKILWLIKLLVEESPRTCGDISRTTGLHRKDVDDACYELVRSGDIKILPDSRLAKINYEYRNAQ